MDWFLNKNWDDESHGDFYRNYRKAHKELQSTALIKQAELLANT